VRATRALRRPRGWAFLVAVVLAAGVPLVGGTLGGAQALSFTLTVKKVVTGVVPPGTTFTVTVSCVTQDSTGTGAGSSDATTPTTGGAHTASDSFPSTITFNANGDPTTTNTGSLIVGESCTVAENPPGTGGAQSVSYGCATTNASDVACVSNQQVRVIPDNSAGGAATITVTNAFPTPTTAPPVVVAAPKFTG
jgi:hypothetical protein